MKNSTRSLISTILIIYSIIVLSSFATANNISEYTNSDSYEPNDIVWYEINGTKTYFKCVHPVLSNSYNIPSKWSYYWTTKLQIDDNKTANKQAITPVPPPFPSIPLTILPDTQILLIAGNPVSHTNKAGFNPQLTAVTNLFKKFNSEYNVILLIGDKGINNSHLTTTQKAILDKNKDRVFPATKANILAYLKSKDLFVVYYIGDGGKYSTELIINNSAAGNDSLNLLTIDEIATIDFKWNVTFIVDACYIFTAPFGNKLMYKAHARNFMGGVAELWDRSGARVSENTLINMLGEPPYPILEAWRRAINITGENVSLRHSFGGHWGVTTGVNGFINPKHVITSNTDNWDSNSYSGSLKATGKMKKNNIGNYVKEYTASITNSSSAPLSLSSMSLPMINDATWSFTKDHFYYFGQGSFPGSQILQVPIANVDTNSAYLSFISKLLVIPPKSTKALNFTFYLTAIKWNQKLDAQDTISNLNVYPYLKFENNPNYEPVPITK